MSKEYDFRMNSLGPNYRNMIQQNEEILKCLRNKSVTELTRFHFEDNPSFLTAMGPSRDGIIIPANFGQNNGRSTTRQRRSDNDPFSVTSKSTRMLRSQPVGNFEVPLQKLK